MGVLTVLTELTIVRLTAQLMTQISQAGDFNRELSIEPSQDLPLRPTIFTLGADRIREGGSEDSDQRSQDDEYSLRHSGTSLSAASVSLQSSLPAGREYAYVRRDSDGHAPTDEM